MKKFKGATLEKRVNLYILKTKGSPYERGLQHGTLLKEEINQGILDYYADWMDSGIDCIVKRVPHPFRSVSEFLMRTYLKYSYKKLIKHIPKEIIEEARGLSDGSEVPLERVTKAMVIPDILFYSIGKAFGANKELDQFINSNGCSSVVTWDKATKDGKIIYGRNLDFWGVDLFERNPVVTFAEPENGMKYVAITSAGVGTAGITTMNESGLTIALHVAISKNTSLNAVPSLPICSEVARKASSIDDAIKIAGSYRSAAGFTIFLVDGKKREAAAIELSAGGQSVRKVENDFMIQTNHYLDKKMVEHEAYLNASIKAHTIARYKRLEHLVKENYGNIDVEKMTEFLSDNYDIFLKKERPIGSIVTQPNNVSSVVFCPEEKGLWVAVGTAPVCHNEYLYLDFDKEFENKDYGIKLVGGKKSKTRKSRALKKYLEAYILSERHKKNKDIISRLEEAIKVDEEPIFYQILGLYKLKEKQYREAIRIFDKALEFPDLPQKMANNHFWKGLAYDLLGEKENAIEEYNKVISFKHADHALKKAAKSNKARGCPPSYPRILEVDFIFADAVGY